MGLRILDKNNLTNILLRTTNKDGISLQELSDLMSVDKDVILAGLKSMQQVTYQLIYVNGVPDNISTSDVYMVKIPENEKWRAEDILSKDGWGKIYDQYFEQIRFEKEEENRRKKLEEESWIATREQAEKANKHARRANVIASVSVVIALITIILQFSKC